MNTYGAAAIGAREIIMVTDRETGIATVRQRGADPMAGRSAIWQGLSMEERAVRSRSCAEPTQEPGRRKRMQLDWGRRGWTSHNCFGPPSCCNLVSDAYKEVSAVGLWTRSGI